ncbi:cryptochrome/photolyase family protein [Kocuria rosea]|uniref:cryptochrome/photolyase family protein n=1 Tax=Kocuria rosea TaxID=1275 RepID=UPI002040E8AB|nr:deoxyribodipyrimidine photo-lyase [Kocuria rosea]MCM3687990.1 DNA photolyase family protein [Kocuria rosea]
MSAPESPDRGTTTIVWFRDDLRVTDHPALQAACRRGAVVALYVLDEVSEGVRPLGAAARWWLHGSLTALGTSLAELGIPLVLRRGPARPVLGEVLERTGAGGVTWNRRYGGPERAVDAAVKQDCARRGVAAHSFHANLLHEPWTLRTGTGGPYKVYTPFWKALRTLEIRQPLPAPTPGHGAGPVPAAAAGGEDLHDWDLLPDPEHAEGLAAAWTPGEAAAWQRLDDFLDGVAGYAEGHDRPDRDGTSRLSPHLRWGEISPFAVWDAAVRHRAQHGSTPGLEKFLAELGWREFDWHLLHAHPDLHERHLRPRFDAFPWRGPQEAAGDLRAWQDGRTGLPLVDAGMRQMASTGWMHNRVRMVTASLLVKNLLVDWRAGEQWFWDRLVDADPASGPANWQWVAGSGADASPFFRIFNPLTQGRRFDPEARYVRRWVPELAGEHGVDPHEPGLLGPSVGYPEPIVDLRASRQRALDAYAATA